MKNILITSTCRDNQGTSLSFVKDINDIKDDLHRTMIINCINNIKWENGYFWSSGDGMCGSENGYIFNNYVLFDKMLPITVEHIVDYVF